MSPPDSRPERERRGSAKADTGARRRRVDRATFEEDVRDWMRDQDRWVRDWTSRMEERVTDAEEQAAGNRALLDGSAGNDGGIIGTLGEIRGEMRAVNARLDRQAQATDEIRRECKTIKETAEAISGNTAPPPPKTFGEQAQDVFVKLVLPIVLGILPLIGVVVAAYFQLKGQLAGVDR